MARIMLTYTKSILESVSFDPELFEKELEKALEILLPHEMEDLNLWLQEFTTDKPTLEPSLQLLSV